MRVLLRKRYYCDHCKRAGGSRVHMEKHEKGCTNNPGRVCGMCALVGSESFPAAELQRVLNTEGWQALCDKVENCPACILATQRQADTSGVPSLPYDDPRLDGLQRWSFKDALKSWWDDYNANRDDGGPY